MISIDNDYYNIELYQLLVQLRNDIYEKTERALFKDIIKKSNGQVSVTCPIHKRGMENKPSCFISENGLVHCFSCNYSGTIYSMISELLFNKRDGGIKGKEYLLNNIKGSRVNDRKKQMEKFLSKIKRRHEPIIQKEKRVVSQEELDKYAYIHPYMYKRHMTDEIIEKFDIGFDNNYPYMGKKIATITFPVKDLEGDVITIIRRAISFKRFFIERFIEKPIYGLYEINKTKEQDIYITESIFNCLTLWTWGYQAVALIGLGNNKQIDILNKLENRLFYICMDGDDAGRNAALKIKQKLKNKFIYNIDMYEGKDINDLSKGQFERLKNECKFKRG